MPNRKSEWPERWQRFNAANRAAGSKNTEPPRATAAYVYCTGWLRISVLLSDVRVPRWGLRPSAASLVLAQVRPGGCCWPPATRLHVACGRCDVSTRHGLHQAYLPLSYVTPQTTPFHRNSWHAGSVQMLMMPDSTLASWQALHEQSPVYLPLQASSFLPISSHWCMQGNCPTLASAGTQGWPDVYQAGGGEQCFVCVCWPRLDTSAAFEPTDTDADSEILRPVWPSAPFAPMQTLDCDLPAMQHRGLPEALGVGWGLSATLAGRTHRQHALSRIIRELALRMYRLSDPRCVWCRQEYGRRAPYRAKLRNAPRSKADKIFSLPDSLTHCWRMQSLAVMKSGIQQLAWKLWIRPGQRYITMSDLVTRTCSPNRCSSWQRQLLPRSYSGPNSGDRPQTTDGLASFSRLG